MHWYYERDGREVGPVSQSEMVRLIIHRHIRPQTLVWHPGFGNEWRPASKAGLVSPSAGVRLFVTVGGRSSTRDEGVAGAVSSVWAWLMLVPGLVDLLLLVVGQRTHWAVTPDRPVTGVCIYVILFLTLIKDRQTLARAGVKPPSFWWWLFLPGYFWCRMKVLRRGVGLFSACLFLGFLEAGILLSNPPPGFEPLLKLKQAEKPVASSPRELPRQDGQASHGDGGSGASSDGSPDQNGHVEL